MQTKQLEYILTISRCQSLSAAAKELGISQPALSKYLSSLQQELGVELFLRYNKKLIPTPSGNTYIEAARKIVDIRQLTYQTIRQLGAPPRKKLVIGASYHNGASLAASIFPKFRKQFPEIDIVIREGYVGALRQMLADGTIDLAIMSIANMEDSQFSFATHGKTELFLIIPRFHKMASMASSDIRHPTVVELRAFEDSPFILPGAEATSRQMIDSIFLKSGFTPTIIYETNNTLTIKEMIAQGGGVSFVSHMTQSDLKRFAYFSISPGYYMHIGIGFRNDHILSEEEKYYIYLSLLYGGSNLIFHEESYNQLAKEIIEQMEAKYGHPDY